MKLQGMKAETHHRTFRALADMVVVIQAREYEGVEHLDIRKYWWPGFEDDPLAVQAEYIPTGEGLRIPWALVPEFLSALVNVVGEVDDDLLDDIR